METENITFEPLPLVTLSRDGTLQVNTDNLSTITKDVENIPLSIISICGSRANGKSLLLGYAIKYLFKSDINTEDWLGSSNPDAPLTDTFKWPGGKTPDKPEIWAINPPHIMNLDDNGKQVAILIIYTQGLAYNNSDVDLEAGYCSLLGLTLAISSVTVLNVYKTLNEATIKTLADGVKYSLHGTGLPLDSKKFHCPELVFTIRDWNFNSQFAYGKDGGTEYVNQQKLKIEDERYSIDLKAPRKIIQTFFDGIKGYLLPYPGDNVIKPANVQGSLSEMEKPFREHLGKLIEVIVNKRQPTIRTDSDKLFTGKDLQDLKTFVAVCNDGYDGVDLDHLCNIHLEPNNVDLKLCIRIAVREYADTWATLVKDEKKLLSEVNCRDFDNKARSKAEEILNGLCSKIWELPDGTRESNFRMRDKVQRETNRMQADLHDRCNLILTDFENENERKKDLFLYGRQQAALTQYIAGMRNLQGYGASSEMEFLNESKNLMQELANDFKVKIKEFFNSSQINVEVEKLQQLLVEQEEDFQVVLPRA